MTQAQTYSILSTDKKWCYNYDDEICEKHDSIGRPAYRFNDLSLAKKCLEELEDDDFSIYDNNTGEKVS